MFLGGGGGLTRGLKNYLESKHKREWLTYLTTFNQTEVSSNGLFIGGWYMIQSELNPPNSVDRLL